VDKWVVSCIQIGGAVWWMLTWWRHLRCVCSVKAVWSTPERYRSDAFHLRRYTNVIPLYKMSYLYLLPLYKRSNANVPGRPSERRRHWRPQWLARWMREACPVQSPVDTTSPGSPAGALRRHTAISRHPEPQYPNDQSVRLISFKKICYVLRPPCGALSVTALISLVTSTFDLLTSK